MSIKRINKFKKISNHILIQPPKNIIKSQTRILSSKKDRRLGYMNNPILKLKNFLNLKIGNIAFTKNIFIISLKISGT